ncbi:uncharacterized protein DUF2793 [Rhodovulum imhoffii]|uniref:Uncharacterized protein DUF2793 n=1 Tax=Rhodovulum imhoffii TaxID=365340 RepID=A0A2T5BPD3_9RHOB|nr:DUF2793 domain-containing protein [Rhodovulum imhoffii]MBK5932931.1 hypothetical protein [Rhodovulum imhoffii]PTN00867.1 uncharacterized protein DUF2793 [Rhodovulum imhoffii]
MPDISANLALPFILSAQAQKHVTHNEALRVLDAVVQLAVESHSLKQPPAMVEEGARYIVAAGGTGPWQGRDDSVAVFDNGGWMFLAPRAGWRAYDRETGAGLLHDGAAWIKDGGNHQNLPGVGVNAAFDKTNRLAVSSPATLLTHEGAGHQLKVNKAGAADTASLLFQTDWSGRAEMGTAGTDDFAIKVSADGTAWTEALRISGSSGHVSGAALQQAPADTTPGRLARADFVYGPGNVVGPVNDVDGVPSGAVIEQGKNANGEYVRFADGTQICWHAVTCDATGETRWVFPAGFQSWPVASVTPHTIYESFLAGRFFERSLNWIDFSVFQTGDTRRRLFCHLLAFGRWKREA